MENKTLTQLQKRVIERLTKASKFMQEYASRQDAYHTFIITPALIKKVMEICNCDETEAINNIKKVLSKHLGLLPIN